MDIFSILVLVAISGAALVAYLYFFKKDVMGERILVNYSEKVGNTIVESDKEYTGIMNLKDDILFIPKLKLKRPIPPRKVMLVTHSGKKKVYIIKIDNFRYGFRIPSLKNAVYIEKRDENGNVIKHNGKPVLIKHKWTLCEDVIEPDVNHWEEHEQELNRKRHQLKEDLWTRWGAPISLVMIFLFGVIIFNQGAKVASEHYDRIMERAIATQDQAQETTRNINLLMEKLTGQKILTDDDAKRAKYYNETKKK